ncbi:CARDB domain-containing protein [Chloroflexota bacterium]
MILAKRLPDFKRITLPLLLAASLGISAALAVPAGPGHAISLETGLGGIYENMVNPAPAIADLIVQSITCSPEYPSVGDEATFDITLKNQGNDPTGSFRVKFYIDNIYLTDTSVTPLAAGATVTKTFTWKVAIGSHEVKAVADAAGEVAESDEGNNETVFSFAPLAPDLIVQEISLTPTGPSKGDIISFDIVIKNRGSSNSRPSKVSFFIDDTTRGDLDVPIINSGATATRTFTWTAKAGTHEVKAVADTNNLVVESDETNNEKTLTFATLAPDLIIETISWSPEKPSKGDDVTFTVTVKNQGTGRADYSYVAFYVNDTSLGSDSVTPLESGESTSRTFIWQTTAGIHTIKAIADSNTWLEETDETNNEKDASFAPLAPDLIIENISWSPANPSVGDSVTFSITVKNEGSGRADNSRVTYYLEGTGNANLTTSAIEGGATTTTSFTWSATAGTRSLKAVADSAEMVVESNEDNNQKTVTFTPIAPDLSIQDITWSPEDPLPGDNIVFNIIIKNQSTGKAGNSHLALYIDNTFFASTFVGTIAADATSNETLSWTVAPGLHDITAVADANNQVSENDETNNEKAFTFAPAAPDLIIDSITCSPANPQVGDKVSFTINIKNQGNGRAESSHVAYYIDEVPRGYHDLPEIEAGATISKGFTWTAEAGSHAISTVADSNENLTESNETNNRKTLNLPPADLVIQDATWSPENPLVGDVVTFSIIVKNLGSGNAKASRIVYTIAASDQVYVDVPPIAAGATATPNFTWTATANSPEIQIFADAGDALAELDETNNEKIFTFAPAVPDLTIPAIDWSLPNPNKTDEVTFTIDIENQGSSRADSFQIDCYTDGVYLISATIDPIDPGTTVTKTFTFTAESGSHDIKVVADTLQTITESNETNNERTVTFSTIMPDLVIEKATLVPESSHVGDLITLNVTVKNQGTGKAGASRIGYYINDSLKGYNEIPTLNAGAVTSKTFTWIAEEGKQDITIAVDSNDVILEINESNNNMQTALTAQAANAAPGNPTSKRASSDSPAGKIPLQWWQFIVGGGILLSIVICLLWMKSQ